MEKENISRFHKDNFALFLYSTNRDACLCRVVSLLGRPVCQLFLSKARTSVFHCCMMTDLLLAVVLNQSGIEIGETCVCFLKVN